MVCDTHREEGFWYPSLTALDHCCGDAEHKSRTMYPTFVPFFSVRLIVFDPEQNYRMKNEAKATGHTAQVICSINANMTHFEA